MRAGTQWGPPNVPPPHCLAPLCACRGGRCVTAHIFWDGVCPPSGAVLQRYSKPQPTGLVPGCGRSIWSRPVLHDLALLSQSYANNTPACKWLLYSNTPENVTTVDGVFYNSNAYSSGCAYPNRLVFENVDSTGSALTFAIVVRNTSASSSAQVNASNLCVASTTPDDYSGQQAAHCYFQGSGVSQSTGTIPAGGFATLYTQTWNNGYPMDGYANISVVSGSAQIYLVETSTSENPLTWLESHYSLQSAYLPASSGTARGDLFVTDQSYASANPASQSTNAYGMNYNTFPSSGDSYGGFFDNGYDYTGPPGTAGTSTSQDGKYGVIFTLTYPTWNSSSTGEIFGLPPSSGEYMTFFGNSDNQNVAGTYEDGLIVQGNQYCLDTYCSIGIDKMGQDVSGQTPQFNVTPELSANADNYVGYYMH